MTSDASDRPPADVASPDADLDPDMVAGIVLLSLPKMGPARIRWLLSELSPADVVAHLAAGSLPTSDPWPDGVGRDLVRLWGQAIRSTDLAAMVADQFVEGRQVIGPDHRCWPFHHDPEPPLLLFCAGDVELLTVDRLVSVVGTRRCSAVGRRVAHRLGLDLATSGVSVVSGLAVGIDAAVHHGCLDGGGRPVAVVASGLDVIYPETNRALWTDVVSHGVVVSEAPAGTKPRRWRFPARNRLIASLGRGTVIVESHRRGGALITADEAADRGRPVMSVPGSVLSPSAEGCNGLLMDGAAPVRDADDVLQYLGIDYLGTEQAESRSPTDPTPSGPYPPDPHPSAPTLFDSQTLNPESPAPGLSDDGFAGGGLLRERILLELANGPVTVDDLVSATGAGAAEVLNGLSRLTMVGAVTFDGVTASLAVP